MRHASALLCVLAVGVAAACDDGSPETVMGEWRLTAIDSKSLPVVVDANRPDTASIIGGSYVFTDGNTYMQTHAVEFRGAGAADTVVLEMPGTWRRVGNDVEVTPDVSFEIPTPYTLDYDRGRLIFRPSGSVYERSTSDD